MTRFQRLIPVILMHEGGYVDDPDDPGGETKFGISKRAHPQTDIQRLTEEEAAFIYGRDYWHPWMDDINETTVALQVFDFGVNSGVSHAIRVLQRAAHCAVDGIVGPRTLASVNARGVAFIPIFLEQILLEYTALADRMGQTKFLRSWFHRAVWNAFL